MTLVVEDGTGLSTSESYVSVADCAAYATARGQSFPTTDEAACEAALRRATDYIDSTYGGRYPGHPAQWRNQALLWPRAGAIDASGYGIASDVVPTEIKNATCEAAIRELATPNSLAPDLERGGGVKRVAAGSVEIEYGAGASAKTRFLAIEAALTRLIGQRNSYSGRVSRG